MNQMFGSRSAMRASSKALGRSSRGRSWRRDLATLKVHLVPLEIQLVILTLPDSDCPIGFHVENLPPAHQSMQPNLRRLRKVGRRRRHTTRRRHPKHRGGRRRTRGLPQYIILTGRIREIKRIAAWRHVDVQRLPRSFPTPPGATGGPHTPRRHHHATARDATARVCATRSGGPPSVPAPLTHDSPFFLFARRYSNGRWRGVVPSGDG